MRSHHYPALGPHGFHQVAYTEWGAPDNPRVAICVHGLTRNGRDFDTLARALENDYRVICPDIPGRGRSEWMQDPADYSYPVYVNDMAALIARSGAQQVDWIGTSMGGIIGMMLAAQPGTPIRRLVLNDVGSHIPKASLQRIAEYVGRAPAFPDVHALERYLRTVMASFGKLTDAQWAHMAEHSKRTADDGSLHLHYDPAIAKAFSGELKDVDLTMFWNRVRCPVLIVRGAESDLLLPETVAAMRAGHPQVECHDIPETGHAPALMEAHQVALVKSFLLRP